MKVQLGLLLKTWLDSVTDFFSKNEATNLELLSLIEKKISFLKRQVSCYP